MRTFLFRAVIAYAAFVWVMPGWSAGVLYQAPAEGWLYAYDGVGTNFGSGSGFLDSLDGTWARGGSSDSWDGSGLGGVFEDATNDPGGLQAFDEAGTDFLRLQDVGDPRAQSATLGYTPSDPRNSKLYLLRPLALPGDAIDAGITLAFRIRVATTGVLDAQYPGTAPESENAAVSGGTPWPAEGNGYFNHSGGKGVIGLHQDNGGMISFSPAVASDQRNNQSAFGQSALMTNNLNGTAISGIVDPYNLEAGTENVFAVSDWSQWQEFWITIRAETGGGGTHRIQLFANGALAPIVFDLTAGDGSEGFASSTQTYLGMGLGSTSQMGAVDVDYVAVAAGVIAPVPEPSSGAALSAGVALLCARRGRARRG